MTGNLAFHYPHAHIGNSLLIHANCLDWLSLVPDQYIHAIVTDPPYGVKEFEPEQLRKKHTGKGGIWRIPPAFDGHTRAPLPRFTALNSRELKALSTFFLTWSTAIYRVLRPGGHVMIASNPYLANLVFSTLAQGGLEFRGQIIRLVRTLRGGDRPKNAEVQFPDVCTMPRGCYEPWGLFRRPLPANMTVGECLQTYQTGALRRRANGLPFNDVLESKRTPKAERDIADHPSLKPQAFLRQLVYAALPLGEGIVLDPFMGSGSTLAAAEAVGYTAIGVESYEPYFRMSIAAVPQLARISTHESSSHQLYLFTD